MASEDLVAAKLEESSHDGVLDQSVDDQQETGKNAAAEVEEEEEEEGQEDAGNLKKEASMAEAEVEAKQEDGETKETADKEEKPDEQAQEEEQEQPLDAGDGDIEEDILKLNKFKKTEGKSASPGQKRSRDDDFQDDESRNQAAASNNVGGIDGNEEIEDEKTRKRREFEEKFNALLKKPTKRRKNNDVDLEAMQDEAISHLKNMMKDAAYMDIDCVNNKKPAANKLKLLPQVRDTLLKSNLYDSILDNNLLEAVRIWLEPLPDASLPSFEIQKTLLNELVKLPIKTIHLRESGLGKVMIFYQKSKKVDPALKRIAEKLIGDWTRPVMGRSDNYRAREIPTANFDIEKFKAKTKLQTGGTDSAQNSRKSLYQESADRRKRAAAPEARTSVYTIAPQTSINALHAQRASGLSTGIGQSLSRDERFKALNKKLTKLSQKKKAGKKDGVSIEGRGLNI
ncbi:hypothetical protein PMKS-003239 [Pichia membranifaciens]|uniref:TFIIS N-terminal domain-containing protein n=1 Tax=Pichia membranifaciens TaxID=4926 RepID=A0A1Q2YJM0_9ASCO|nr:hypothetical protein PMKS-003239 [Pichia membranifaciens]